jgi:hypothetical protein
MRHQVRRNPLLRVLLHDRVRHPQPLKQLYVSTYHLRSLERLYHNTPLEMHLLVQIPQVLVHVAVVGEVLR